MPRLAYATILFSLSLAVPSLAIAQPALRPTAPPQTQSGWPSSTRVADSNSDTDPDANRRSVDSYNAMAAATQSLHSQAEGEPFELAETVAQVGDQYILKGELVGDANLILSIPFAGLDKLTPEAREQAVRELLEVREQMMRETLLKQAIERKLKYLEFLRSMPTQADPKKAEEMRNRIQTQAEKMFAENLELMLDKLYSSKEDEYAEIARQSPQLFRLALVMKQANIRTLDDPALDRLLKAHQTSLAKQQQSFAEYAFGQSAIRQKINFQPEITHAEMVAYYREHEAEFRVPHRAQWEQLTALFQRFPNEEAAWNAICQMGNEVYLGGAPFWAVAQRSSQEKNAEFGGFHDWTTFGDLKISKPINDAVFSYELNALSPIIRDEQGFHIIRVTARETEHIKPFSDVQSDIKEQLRTESLNKAYSDYVANLWDRTPVIYPGQQPPADSRMAKPSSPNQGISR